MNGAESLLRTLVGSGVNVCFGNPGTSEMHFVAALDRVEGMRAVLGLFEGAVTGMADGYGRMAEMPAATLLHLGPGLANGLANLHNARRARTPIVNIVGDHATYHAQYDAPLASDVRGFARTVSGWVHSSASARTVATDGALAVQAALQYPGQIATLILPADTAWLEADRPAPALPKPTAAIAAAEAIDQAAGALRSGRKDHDPDPWSRPEGTRTQCGRPYCCGDRRPDRLRHVRPALPARRRARGGGTDSLFRRADRRIHERDRATDLGRREFLR